MINMRTRRSCIKWLNRSKTRLKTALWSIYYRITAFSFFHYDIRNLKLDHIVVNVAKSIKFMHAKTTPRKHLTFTEYFSRKTKNQNQNTRPQLKIYSVKLAGAPDHGTSVTFFLAKNDNFYEVPVFNLDHCCLFRWLLKPMENASIHI